MAGKRIISLALIGLFAAVAQGLPNSRILGGSDADNGVYPHVVSIRVDNAHACVGSILNEHFILTAAHCLSQSGAVGIDASRVTVRVGSINQYAGGQIVGSKSIVIHPSYGNFLYDMAILGLSEPLVFSDKINKINLATEEDVYEQGTPVTVTGWGLNESGASPYKLQQVVMSVLGAPECELQAGYGYDSVICLSHAEKIGICRGDDGAGVVSGGKLIAVSSFSFGSCGTKYPDVSSKISYFSSWINSILA